MPNVYTSSVSGQLSAVERESRRLVKFHLRRAGNAWRNRVRREQLGQGTKSKRGRPPAWLRRATMALEKAGRQAEADRLLEEKGYAPRPKFGVRRITGALIRSARPFVNDKPNGVELVGFLGGSVAPYWWLPEFESKGKLATGRVFEQEVKKIQPDIQTALDLLARHPGQARLRIGGGAARTPEDFGGGARGALLADVAASHRVRRRRVSLARRLRRERRQAGGGGR